MNIKEQVKELWKLCFNDSEAFTELYFRLRYNEEVNLVRQENGKVISAMQLLPYPMTLWGGEIATRYVSGACTHPDFQGKGAMKELLTHSFARMHAQGIPLSTLIPAEPWLFGYYARMGYAPVFHYSTETLPASTVAPQGEIEIRMHTSYQEAEYRYFSQKMAARPCCLQHTEEDYRVILEDLALANGNVVAAYRNGSVTGIAFMVAEENTLYIKELFADDETTKAHLLYQGSKQTDSRLIFLTTPLNDSSGSKVELGMARIVHAHALLKLYAAAHPHVNTNFVLTDPQVAENNGFYSIAKGKCTFSKKTVESNNRTVGIGELAQMLLAPLKPYMSLMLN